MKTTRPDLWTKDTSSQIFDGGGSRSGGKHLRELLHNVQVAVQVLLKTEADPVGLGVKNPTQRIGAKDHQGKGASAEFSECRMELG